jgi:chemotaxis protein MotB
MPFRTFLGLCLLSTVWGCVSLDYYEALRQAYERSEARNQEAKNELARTSAELTRLRELTEAGGPNLLAPKEKEIAELSRQLDATKAALALKEQEMSRTLQGFQATLKDEIAKGSSTVQRAGHSVNVMLAERILYESGSADITPNGLKVLKRVADVLKGSPRTDIRVEGHTDDVPIRLDPPPRFYTNWDLSVARAMRVARYLKDDADVDPSRLSAMGYGDIRPLAANVNEQARAKNRRVEIIVTPAR